MPVGHREKIQIEGQKVRLEKCWTKSLSTFLCQIKCPKIQNIPTVFFFLIT